MTQHRHLLSPLTLRGHTLRNRIVFGAHTANMSDMGIPGPRVQGYLVERALGGAGESLGYAGLKSSVAIGACVMRRCLNAM